jgi:hypothetical protein
LKTSWDRLRGLKSLVADAVEHGSSAIEKVHVATAARPFAVLEHIPPLAAPTKIVRVVHDTSVSVTYESVRVVTRVVSSALGVVIDELERNEARPPR